MLISTFIFLISLLGINSMHIKRVLTYWYEGGITIKIPEVDNYYAIITWKPSLDPTASPILNEDKVNKRKWNI